MCSGCHTAEEDCSTALLRFLNRSESSSLGELTIEGIENGVLDNGQELARIIASRALRSLHMIGLGRLNLLSDAHPRQETWDLIFQVLTLAKTQARTGNHLSPTCERSIYMIVALRDG